MKQSGYEDAVDVHAADTERTYVPNRRLPDFVGDTEIRRLKKVIEEKNSLIAKFKKYDEERKAYVANLQEEYGNMKDFVDSFSEELKEAYQEGELDRQDFDVMMKLFGQWYGYKNSSRLYHGKLKAARSSVRDLKDDLTKLEELLKGVGNISTIISVSDRFMIARQHLDVLAAKLNV